MILSSGTEPTRVMQKSMKRTILTLAFVTFAASAPSQAATGDKIFERLDADKSGDISYEEFVGEIRSRLEKADKDGDGKLTVEEISATFKGPKANQRAKGLVARFDPDKDGTITLADVETKRKERFAQLDANKDGKLVMEEMTVRASAKGDRPKSATQ